MNTKTILLVLLRRWYVVIPIVVGGLVLASVSGGSPTQSVETRFLLVTAPTVSGTTEDANTNPILTTPSAVRSVANVVTVTMHTDSRRAEVFEAGYSPSYDFGVARNDPFVGLTVVDDTPEGAIESSIVLTQLFVEEMTTQQIRFGADPGALVQAELLEISAPIADYSGVRTTQAMIAFATVVVAAILAFAVEGAFYFFGDRRREYRALTLAGEEGAQPVRAPLAPAAPPSGAQHDDSAGEAIPPELETSASGSSPAGSASRSSRWDRT